MYERILVPLDGSELAEAALDYGRDLAGELALSMDILHVYSHAEREFVTMREGYVTGIVSKVQRQLSEQYERQQAEPGGGRREVRGELVMGHAAEEILRYANRNNADIILMATHGRSGLRLWALGSVADKVVRATRRPILLVRAKRNAASMNRIIIPLDGFKQSEAVVDCVASIAAGLKSEVVLLQVLEESYSISTSGGRTVRVRYTRGRMAELEEGARRYLEGVAAPLRDRGITVISEVRTGDAPRVIIKVADERQARMVTMLKRRRSGISPLDLGSVADKILRRGTTPVLLFSAAAGGRK